jgi:hypothetical protein
VGASLDDVAEDPAPAVSDGADDPSSCASLIPEVDTPPVSAATEGGASSMLALSLEERHMKSCPILARI